MVPILVLSCTVRMIRYHFCKVNQRQQGTQRICRSSYPLPLPPRRRPTTNTRAAAPVALLMVFPCCFPSQEESLDLVRKGCENLAVHITNALKYGVKVTKAGLTSEWRSSCQAIWAVCPRTVEHADVVSCFSPRLRYLSRSFSRIILTSFSRLFIGKGRKQQQQQCFPKDVE